MDIMPGWEGRRPIFRSTACSMKADRHPWCAGIGFIANGNRRSETGPRPPSPMSSKAEPATDAFGDVPADGHGLISVAQQDPRSGHQLLCRGAGPDQAPQPLLLGEGSSRSGPGWSSTWQGSFASGVSSAPSASLATHRYWLLTRRSATMTRMAAPPTSTKTSLQQRLSAHARTHWPQLADVTVRFRGAFAGLPEDALDCAAGLYLGDPTL